MKQFDRITQEPGVMGEKRAFAGQIGAGRSIEELLKDYPYLQREDIQPALRFSDRKIST